MLISSSYLTVLGKQVTWYAVTPIIGAAVIAPLHTFLARKECKKLSLFYRVELVLWLAFAAAMPPLASRFSGGIVPFAFIFSAGGIAAAGYLLGKVTGLGGEFLLRQCVLSLMLMTCFTKLGCLLTGCCAGRPWQGALAVTYGENTRCAVKGIALFPAQGTMGLVFLLLWAGFTLWFRKVHRILCTAVALCTHIAAYYFASLWIAPGLDRLHAGGVNYPLWLGLLFLLGAAACFITAYKTKGTIKNEKMAS